MKMNRRILAAGITMLIVAGSVIGCQNNKKVEVKETTVESEVKEEAKSYEQDYLVKIPIDASVYAECSNKGTVETLCYTTPAYAVNEIYQVEETVEKELLVYLPYGYDAEKQYNVLYLMHGGGENHTYWIGENPKGNSTRNMLDNMMENGLAEQTIVVTPTYVTLPEGYEEGAIAEQLTKHFWQELRNEIIPLVESTYSTYATGDISEENLIATRDHRAFAGFSMGSLTTFQSAMMHCTDLMSYFGCYSGAKTDAVEFEVAMAETFKDYEIKYWYNGNGTKDIAHDEHKELFDTVISEIPDKFVDGKNCCWIDFPGGSHAFNCWLPDLYNSLLVFFK